ncbi:MAG TPA: catalase family peroxidase [Thermoleophilaceae bacterium]|nr:catalase family peroxidase [Thermoleophilaceae bacterium]
MVDPVELVDAIGKVGGTHPGHRAAHAKGVLLTGTFTPSADAKRLTRGAQFAGHPVRATVRLSNGGANPHANDAEVGDGRGMAVKFYVGDEETDIVSLSLPVFFVRTPEEFLEFTLARAESFEKVGEFIGTHPATAQAVQQIVPTLAPPRSYATMVFNSIHAFRLTNADGEQRWVRWRWAPEAGVEWLPEEERDGMEPDYLQTEIFERLPVRFTLVARVGTDDLPTDDATAAWPENLETVDMGTLELTGPDTERETGDDVMVMDPARLIDGIELSDDPILHARPGAYSVSVERRIQAPHPA